MTFIKSLFLAIFATLFLTYVLGMGVVEMFDIDLYAGEKLIEPLQAISISALVAVVLVIVALAIILSVFGTLIFVGLIIAGALAMVMVGIFWPILLAIVAIWLITRDKNKPQYS